MRRAVRCTRQRRAGMQRATRRCTLNTWIAPMIRVLRRRISTPRAPRHRLGGPKLRSPSSCAAGNSRRLRRCASSSPRSLAISMPSSTRGTRPLRHSSRRSTKRLAIATAFARRLMSDVSRGLAALDAADRHAKGEDSVRARARIAYLRGSLHFAAGSAAECRRHHEQALALAHAAGDVECEAQALSGLADALYAQGRMRSAHSAFLRCLDLCARESLTRLALPNHCMVAILDVYLGDTGAALARFDRVRRTARDLRYRFAETMC